MSCQSEDDKGYRQPFCSETLLVSTNEENGGSSMDIAERVPPDSRCEIVGETSNVAYPYDEFMIDSSNSSKESHRSLADFLND